MNDVRDMSDVFLEYGRYGETVIHPVAVVFMLCMTGMVLWARRSRMLFAVLLVCVFMPVMQRIVVFGFDFSMFRLITILAWARVLARREYRGFRWCKLDLILVLFTASLAIIHVLRVGPSGIVFRLGTSFDALTTYFLFRVLVRRREQVLLLTQQLAVTVIVLGVFLAFEKITGFNPFAIFGSAPLHSDVRKGIVRAQGPFSHALMAGTFGSVLIPIFIAVFLGSKKRRKLMMSGIFFATIVAAAAGSSGPLVAWLVGLMGWCLWPFRKRTRAMSLTLVGMTILIHLIREKPVWHLIGRISVVTGSTGYHRYRLIDAFITHFGEWALVGTDNAAYWGWGLQDLTNEYVAVGVGGGLLTLILFLLLLGCSFSWLRRIRIFIEEKEGPHSLWTLLTWGFSVSMATHCVSFISVSYFGQMQQFFYIFLAMIPSLARSSRRVARRVSRSSRPSGLGARAERSHQCVRARLRRSAD